MLQASFIGHIHPISSIPESFLRHFKYEKFHRPFDYDKWKYSTHRYISYKYSFPSLSDIYSLFNIQLSLSLSLSLYSPSFLLRLLPYLMNLTPLDTTL